MPAEVITWAVVMRLQVTLEQSSSVDLRVAGREAWHKEHRRYALAYKGVLIAAYEQHLFRNRVRRETKALGIRSPLDRSNERRVLCTKSDDLLHTVTLD